MMERPSDESVNPPWVIRDCDCKGPVCDLCDGHKWYFQNAETAHTVSPAHIVSSEEGVTLRSTSFTQEIE